MDLTRRPDVVIVGAGAGGAAAAWRLTSQGVRVLLLEAGPRFDPVHDYPLDKPGWERRDFPDKPGSRAQTSYGDLGQLDPTHDALASWNAVDGRIVVGRRRNATSYGYLHTQGVGGTTLRYVGEAHRLHPDAFKLNSLTGKGADWPIGYDTLEPYYTAAEEIVGVAGPATDDGRWRSGKLPMPAHPFSTGATRLEKTAQTLGLDWVANTRAANSVPYQDRPACNYCANCSRGCPLGDKGSADVTFIRQAEATGHLQLEPDTQITGLHAGPNARITTLTAVQNGQSFRIETPVLILCGGAVQTPRLLLASAQAGYPNGLANASGHVGKHFMETLYITLSGLAEGLQNSHMGLPADAISWAHSAPGQTTDHAGGFRLNHATQEI